MAWKVVFGVLVCAICLRLLPELVLRMVFAMPRGHSDSRMMRSIRVTSRWTASLLLARRIYTLGTNRRRLVAVSSSLLALGALITAAVLKWHIAGLMLLLR